MNHEIAPYSGLRLTCATFTKECKLFSIDNCLYATKYRITITNTYAVIIVPLVRASDGFPIYRPHLKIKHKEHIFYKNKFLLKQIRQHFFELSEFKLSFLTVCEE